MRIRTVAKILSVALGMHIWFPLVLIISLLKTGLSFEQIKILFPSLLLLNVIVPIGYLFFAQKLKRVSSWDLPKREERHMFLIIVLISSLISIFLIFFFGNKLLFSLTAIGVILLVLILAITRFWKISLHTSLNTAACIVINFLFDWQLPFLYLTIPLIVWARYTLKRHDFKQLLLGVILTASFVLGAFKYLGYI